MFNVERHLTCVWYFIKNPITFPSCLTAQTLQKSRFPFNVWNKTILYILQHKLWLIN